MTAAPRPGRSSASAGAAADRRPVARLGGPAELAAALPHLCGFVPTESLVVVSLHGPRARVGLTVRVDLPPPAHEEPVAAELAGRVLVTGARAALVVLCTEAADDGGLPRAALVARLRELLRRSGISAPDAVLVRDGRWSSYVCRDPRCCPPGGTPLAAAGSTEALSLVQTDAVSRGVAVLRSRDELVAGLAPPAASPEVSERFAQADLRRRTRTAARGRDAVGRAALALWRRALADGPAVPPSPALTADLVVALADVVVRDEVLTSLLDDADALLGLLLVLARATPSPHDVQVCALLGWAAHARGDGGLANVALDRALLGDPGCTLALLSQQALDGQVEPAQVRALLADSRRVLRRVHPWTAP